MTDTKISALPELATPATGDVLPITHLGVTYKIQEQNLVPAQVNSDWNAISGVAQILNKPQLAQTITNVLHKWLNSYNATTGAFTQTQPDYTDLTSLPQLAQTSAAAANKFLTAYDATTGLFANAQPDWSNLTNIPATFPIATPGTLTVSTTNVAAGAHTHAVTNTSVGLVSTLMSTDSGGGTQLTGTAKVNFNSASVPAVWISGTQVQLVGADGGNSAIELDAFGTAGGPQPYVVFRRARNTLASPQAVQLGDVIGGFVGIGYGATGWATIGRASMSCSALETWTDTKQGAKISFSTTPAGGTATLTALTLNGSGQVDAGVSFSIAGGTAYTSISSNPGAAAAILATDASGNSQVVGFTATGGLNVGTATSAATGEIRASAGLRLGGVTTSLLKQKVIAAIANNAVAQLFDTVGPVAIAWMLDSQLGGIVTFVARGGYHTVTIQNDFFATTTTTSGTANKNNIYWSAGNSRYEVENKSGASNAYYIFYWDAQG